LDDFSPLSSTFRSKDADKPKERYPGDDTMDENTDEAYRKVDIREAVSVGKFDCTDQAVDDPPDDQSSENHEQMPLSDVDDVDTHTTSSNDIKSDSLDKEDNVKSNSRLIQKSTRSIELSDDIMPGLSYASILQRLAKYQPTEIAMELESNPTSE
jgi:hypothetical protein